MQTPFACVIIGSSCGHLPGLNSSEERTHVQKDLYACYDYGMTMTKEIRLAVAAEDFGQPLRDAIQRAAKNEVQGVRLNARTEVRREEFSDSALRQLKHMIAEYGLRVAGLMYSSRHSVHDQHSLDQRLDGIREALRMARKLGTSEVLVRVGRIPDPEQQQSQPDSSRASDDDVDSLSNPFSYAPTGAALKQGASPSEARQFEILCGVLNDLAAFGSQHGAIPQLQLAAFDPVRTARLLSWIKSGPVGLVFDPATCVMTGGSPVRIYRELYHSIQYVRARDAQKDVDGSGIEVPLGDGDVDWTELMPTLTESDYSGWFCIERPGGDQRDEDVGAAVRRIRLLLPARV
jgi:sugar phosphate isomerase/epimerase